jgi:putative membrane protein
MAVLIRWILSALAFIAVANLVPGITVASFWTALVLALLWGLIGVTIKPVVLVLTLPINVLTLGVFTFIINGFFLSLLGGIVKGFEVQGFWVAVLGALVLSVINMLINWGLEKAKASN